MRIFHQSSFDSWPLEDKSIQLICTSPPYWGLRKYDIPDCEIGAWRGQYGLEPTDLRLVTPTKLIGYLIEIIAIHTRAPADPVPVIYTGYDPAWVLGWTEILVCLTGNCGIPAKRVVWYRIAEYIKLFKFGSGD